MFVVNCTSSGCQPLTTRPAPIVGPPKRDFQDANPPKTLEDWYARYDPSVGIGIALTLGFFLFYLLAKVAVKWTWKRIKLRLQHTRRFGKYFPVKELPPLEELEKIALQQGINLNESLGDILSTLQQRREKTPPTMETTSKKKKIYRRQAEIRRLSQEIERNAVLITTNNKIIPTTNKRLCFVDDYRPPITVNIIGATPLSSESTDVHRSRRVSNQHIQNDEKSDEESATIVDDDELPHIDDEII